MLLAKVFWQWLLVDRLESYLRVFARLPMFYGLSPLLQVPILVVPSLFPSPSTLFLSLQDAGVAQDCWPSDHHGLRL